MTRAKKPASILSITLYCLYAGFVRGIQVVLCLGLLVLALSGRSLAGPGEPMTRHPATGPGGASQDGLDAIAHILSRTAGTALASQSLPGHVPGHV